MTTPTVIDDGVATVPTDLCPICGWQGHLMSDHTVEAARQCSKCSCVVQDTSGGG